MFKQINGLIILILISIIILKLRKKLLKKNLTRQIVKIGDFINIVRFVLFFVLFLAFVFLFGKHGEWTVIPQ